MRVHSLQKIEKAKKLRKNGYSLNEISKLLTIPVPTVWHHVHAIRLSPFYARILKAKQGGSANRRKVGLAKAESESLQLLASHHRESFIVLAMLYWGEGSKGVCELINSDGRLIALYLEILRKDLSISESRIKPTMRFFTGMSKGECLKYWVRVTGIPAARFKINYNDGGTRGRTQYGMCRITVTKGAAEVKLFHALINNISASILPKQRQFLSPRSSTDRAPQS